MKYCGSAWLHGSRSSKRIRPRPVYPSLVNGVGSQDERTPESDCGLDMRESSAIPSPR